LDGETTSTPENTGLFVQTIIGVRVKKVSLCLERIKGLLNDAHVMIVVMNPAKQGALQPMVITAKTLANGLSQMSGLIDKQTAIEVEEFFQKLPPLSTPDYKATAASSLDLPKVITENKLEKGDVIAFLFIRGSGDSIQRAIAGLRNRILLAPFVLGYTPKYSGRGPSPWPWIFPWFLTTKNLPSLETEITRYFNERKLTAAPAIALMNELHEELKKHRVMSTLPPLPNSNWGSGIY